MEDITPTDDAGYAAVPRWLVKDDTVPGHAKLVYLVLAAYSDRYSAAFPSHKTIARKAGLGVTSVKRALGDLELLGVVEKVPQRRSDGGKTSNEYRISTHQPVDNRPTHGRQATMPHSRGDYGDGRQATIKKETQERTTESPSLTPRAAVDNSRRTTDAISAANPKPRPSRTPRIDDEQLATVAHRIATDDWTPTTTQMHALAVEICSRAPAPVIDPTAYAMAAIRNHGFEWQKYALEHLDVDERSLG